jgi:hypothetical protein
MYITRAMLINKLYLKRKCLTDSFAVHKATHLTREVLVKPGKDFSKSPTKDAKISIFTHKLGGELLLSEKI